MRDARELAVVSARSVVAVSLHLVAPAIITLIAAAGGWRCYTASYAICYKTRARLLALSGEMLHLPLCPRKMRALCVRAGPAPSRLII